MNLQERTAGLHSLPHSFLTPRNLCARPELDVIQIRQAVPWWLSPACSRPRGKMSGQAMNQDPVGGKQRHLKATWCPGPRNFLEEVMPGLLSLPSRGGEGGLWQRSQDIRKYLGQCDRNRPGGEGPSTCSGDGRECCLARTLELPSVQDTVKTSV